MADTLAPEREVENLGIMPLEEAQDIFDSCKGDDEVSCMLSVNTTVVPWEAEVKLYRKESSS